MTLSLRSTLCGSSCETSRPDSALVRCHLNGYTYGTDGYFHTDSQRSDEHTTILYMVDHWQPDWAGETGFLGENGEMIKAVLPGVIGRSDFPQAPSTRAARFPGNAWRCERR